MSDITLAIDIGGSKLLVGFVDASGGVLCFEHSTWSSLDSENILKDILNTVNKLKNKHPEYSPSAAGIIIPGLADPYKGIWKESSYSGIRDFPIAERLSPHLKLPVFIDRDTCACAVAEKKYGVCKYTDHFIWVTVSTGIGGAVYANGELYYGSLGNAGEIGHICVSDHKNSRQCKCGNKGCLEIYAAGPAIAKTYSELTESTGAMPSIDAKEIADLARNGDKHAQQAFEMAGSYLGKALAASSNLLNPEKIVLGGGVSMAFDLFQPALMKSLQEHVYRNANKHIQVEQTGLGYHAALVGAAAIASRRNEERKCK